MMDSKTEFDRWWYNGIWAKCNMAKTAPFEAWQACQALNDAKIAELEAKLKVASEALENYVNNSYEQSAGGGDFVAATCESREKAIQALDKMKG